MATRPISTKAHLKEFETRSARDSLETKWIDVKLQILVRDEREARAVRRRLVKHMEREPRRLLKVSE